MTNNSIAPKPPYHLPQTQNENRTLLNQPQNPKWSSSNGITDPTYDMLRFFISRPLSNWNVSNYILRLRQSRKISDYSQVCNALKPDIALFESGYRSHGSRRISISNTESNPSIPKVGLHHGDAWCDRRAGFLSDMDEWGIDTFFTISASMPDYTRSIIGQLYVWPHSINSTIFQDYRLPKSHTILLSGQTFSLYPWRQWVFPLCRDHFQCFVPPRFDYRHDEFHKVCSIPMTLQRRLTLVTSPHLVARWAGIL